MITIDEVCAVALAMGFRQDSELTQATRVATYVRPESDGERIISIGGSGCTITKVPTSAQYLEPAPKTLRYAVSTEDELRAYLDRSAVLVKPRAKTPATVMGVGK